MSTRHGVCSLVLCLLALSGSHPRGQASPGAAFANIAAWRARVTMTVTFAHKYQDGDLSVDASLVAKTEMSFSVLDDRSASTYSDGKTDVIWKAKQPCQVKVEYDERLTSTGPDHVQQYTARANGTSSSPSCGHLSLSSPGDTYEVGIPDGQVSGQITETLNGKDLSPDISSMGLGVSTAECCSEIPLPGAVGTLSGTRTVPISLPARVVVSDPDGQKATAVITWEFTPEQPLDTEAVIVPGAAYPEWTPEGPSGSYQPPPIEITVRAHRAGKPGEDAPQGVRFKFELVSTSAEPGYCLNAPMEAFADKEPDLTIDPSANPELTVTAKGQVAETKTAAQEATVAISAKDWGGWTTLRVTAILPDGKTTVAYVEGKASTRELALPQDDNGNRIADAWEREHGILQKNYPADWDGLEEPADHKFPGDGISLYEKYRGFEFDGEHESLDPKRKYLFVYDQYDLHSKIPYDIQPIAGVSLRLIDKNAWSGRGSASYGARVVNFNDGWGHVTDQHAVHLTLPDAAAVAEVGRAFGTNAAGVSAAVGTQMGTTWPDGPDIFGPPKRTLLAWVYSSEIARDIGRDLEDGWCTSGTIEVSGMIRRCLAAKQYEQYEADHHAALEERFWGTVGLVVVHELAHTIGVQHHEGVADGDPNCIMRYKGGPKCSGPVDPADPARLACYRPWPTALSKTDSHAHGGVGCFRQIVLSDAR